MTDGKGFIVIYLITAVPGMELSTIRKESIKYLIHPYLFISWSEVM